MALHRKLLAKLLFITLLLILSVTVIVSLFVIENNDSDTDNNSTEYSLVRIRENSLEDVVAALQNTQLFKYELIYNEGESDYTRSSEQILAETKYPSEIPINWEWKYEDNRSLNFELHTLEMVNPLLIGHRNNSNEEYLISSFEIALDWVNQNRTELINNQDENFAWYDMAVGIRLYRLSYIFDQMARSNLASTNDLSVLWFSIIDHLEYLSDDDNIIFRNNHGLYQAAGQMATARRFQAVSSEFSGIKNEATERFNSMLDDQFTNEGVHKEHSPDYHRLVYLTILDMKKEGLIDSRADELVTKAGDALYWMIKPDGTLNTFGDTDYRFIQKDKNRYYDDSSELLWSYINDEDTLTPYLGAYPDSGVVAVNKNDSYFYLQSAFHSRTHKHADESSFVWYEGEDILIDPGKYGYLDRTELGDELSLQGFWYGDPYRVYVERTRAHNTVEINDSDYLRRKREPFGSGITKQGESEQAIYYVESRVLQFDTVQHTRRIIYSPGEWLLVLDNLEDSEEKNNNYKQWFQLASSFNVNQTAEGFLARSENNTVHITDILGETSTNGPISGQKSPQYQGWYSPDVFEIEPSSSINFEREDNDSTFATLFSLSDTAPKVLSKSIDTDASKGEISWSSDKKHTLKFDFTPDDTAVITYK